MTAHTTDFSAQDTAPDDVSTTIEVAKQLGLAVRSVQLMVDRGELVAWKTAGGHRRISRASVQRWLAQRQAGGAAVDVHAVAGARPEAVPNPNPGERRGAPRVLLIEDSRHYQNLIKLLMQQQFPHAELSVADDGIAGLAMAGQLQPEVLLVDILLPGIDGATLIARLRSHPQFQRSRLIVETSLDEEQRGLYAFALTGLPVVHKPRLVQELPALLAESLRPLG